MTFTVPVWLLYALYIIGGILVVGALFVVAAFAFVGWALLSNWKPPNW